MFEFFVVTSWHVKIPSFWETIYSLYPLLKVVSGISLHPIVHSNISKKLDQSPKEKIIPEIENCVYSVIANNNLKIQSKDIKVCKSGNGYQILRNCQKLFIIFKDNDSWYLKTQPVIK